MRGVTYSARADYGDDCTVELARAYSAGGALDVGSVVARASLIRAGLMEPIPGCRRTLRLTKAGYRRAAVIWATLVGRHRPIARLHRRDRNRIIHRNGSEGPRGPWTPGGISIWPQLLR